MKVTFNLFILAISFPVIFSLSSMDHTANNKQIKIYTSKFKIPVGSLDFTNLYSLLSKVPLEEKESIQAFFNDINAKALKALSIITEKYATKNVTFELFANEIHAVLALANCSIKAFDKVEVSNPFLKEQILFEYQRIILEIVKHFIATGNKINSTLIDDLTPHKKTIISNYKEVLELKSKL